MALAENRYIAGVGKQSAKGTPVAAAIYPKWGDRTSLNPDLKAERIREGDGSASLTRAIKNLQFYKGVIQHAKAKSIDLAQMIKAPLGTGSDGALYYGVTGRAYANATAKSGLLDSGTGTDIAAGATTFRWTVTGATPAPATNDWLQIGDDYLQEIAQATAVTGAGPYTVTVAALKNKHSAGSIGTNIKKSGTIATIAAGNAGPLVYTAVQGGAPVVNDIFIVNVNVNGTSTAEVFKATAVSGAGPYNITPDHSTVYAHTGPAQAVMALDASAPAGTLGVFCHTFAPQMTRDFYTLYGQYLLGTPESLKIQDAQFHSMKIDGKAGSILDISYDFSGIVGLDDTTLLVPTFDASSGPYHFTNGIFNVDGSYNVGNVAPFMRKFTVDHKHALDDTMQTELITLADFVSTIREIDVSYELLWQDFSQFKKAYFLSGTTDSGLMGVGSAQLNFYPNGDTTNPNLFRIIIPNIQYEGAMLPDPKLSGKAFLQTIKGVAAVYPEVLYSVSNSQFLIF